MNFFGICKINKNLPIHIFLGSNEPQQVIHDLTLYLLIVVTLIDFLSGTRIQVANFKLLLPTIQLVIQSKNILGGSYAIV